MNDRIKLPDPDRGKRRGAAETAVTDVVKPSRVGTQPGGDSEILFDAYLAQPRWQTLLITAGAALAEVLMVVGGYTVGTRPHAELPQKLAILSGLALAIVSVFLPQPRATRSINRQCMLCLCMYVFLMDSNWILWVGDTWSLLRAILFLLPVIIGGLLLPRRGSWLGGVACWLVLFSAVVGMAYNVWHWRGTVLGFFSNLIVD